MRGGTEAGTEDDGVENACKLEGGAETVFVGWGVGFCKGEFVIIAETEVTSAQTATTAIATSVFLFIAINWSQISLRLKGCL
jgi:hypothetical protein